MKKIRARCCGAVHESSTRFYQIHQANRAVQTPGQAGVRRASAVASVNKEKIQLKYIGAIYYTYYQSPSICFISISIYTVVSGGVDTTTKLDSSQVHSVRFHRSQTENPNLGFAPEAEATVLYGQYSTTLCRRSCHVQQWYYGRRDSRMFGKITTQ